MLFWKKSLPGSLYCQTRLQQLPTLPVDVSDYNILETPNRAYKRILELIKSAKERILIAALYLQDDETGRNVLNALYEAKEKNPKLYIRVYVDFHRAQRGLIGKGPSLGNSELYYKKAINAENPPRFLSKGFCVKKRRLPTPLRRKWGFPFGPPSESKILPLIRHRKTFSLSSKGPSSPLCGGVATFSGYSKVPSRPLGESLKRP